MVGTMSERKKTMSAGASSPAAITHGLSLRGASLTWLLLEGIKSIENRSVRLPRGWIALHTGMGKITTEKHDELRRRAPQLPDEKSLPHGVIMGAIRVDSWCAVEHCAGNYAAGWASGPVCNVVGAVALLAQPVAHKGALGVWPISSEVLPLIQDMLAAAIIRETDPARLPPPVPSPAASGDNVARGKRKRHDATEVGGRDKRDSGASSTDQAQGDSVASMATYTRAIGCPTCKYGLGCYRRSAEHWAEYDHPAAHPMLKEPTGGERASGDGCSHSAGSVPPSQDSLIEKLIKLVPGTPPDEAQRALLTHGNLSAAAYALRSQSVPTRA